MPSRVGTPPLRDESKSCSEFQKKPSDVADQSFFDVPLMSLIPNAKKIKEVRILQRLRCKRGIRRREVKREVCDGGPLSSMKLVFDASKQGRPRPPLLNRLRRIPSSFGFCGNVCENRHEVESRQSVSRLLTDWFCWTFFCKKPHIFQEGLIRP
jgi:hypothetical protein